MKKIIAISLLCTMILGCFAGCGIKQGSVGAYASGETVAFVEPSTTGTQGLNKVDVVLDHILTTPSTITSATPVTDWYNDTDTEFVLENADELWGFFELRKTKTFAGKTVKLLENTDMKLDKVIEPAPASVVFQGTFDGQGNTISGITVNSDVGNISIFGYLGNGAVVKNFSIIDSAVNVLSVGPAPTDAASTYYKDIGGLFTNLVGGATAIVDNIYNDVDMYVVIATPSYASTADEGTTNEFTATGVSKYGIRIGGFFGAASCAKTSEDAMTLKVSNCIYAGSIQSNAKQVGGYVGEVRTNCNATFTNCKTEGGTFTPISSGYVGGANPTLAAYQAATSAPYTGNYTTGSGETQKIYKPSASKIAFTTNIVEWGGIAGGKGSSGSVTFFNCENNVAISSAGKNVGGILGKVGNAGTVTLTNCLNTANITASGGEAGGMIGATSTSNANSSVNLTNCINQGNISAPKDYLGGMIGRVASTASAFQLNLKGCINKGNVTITNNGGRIGGMVGNIDLQHANKNNKVNAIGCVNEGTIDGKPTTKDSGKWVGGLFGYVYGAQKDDTNYYIGEFNIIDCTVTGTVKGNRCSGGLVGLAQRIKTIVIKGCTANANITVNLNQTANSNAYSGILAGIIADGESSGTVTVTDCVAGGTYSVTKTQLWADSADEEKQKASVAKNGAIIGFYRDANSKLTISNCYVDATFVRTGLNDDETTNYVLGGSKEADPTVTKVWYKPVESAVITTGVKSGAGTIATEANCGYIGSQYKINSDNTADIRFVFGVTDELLAKAATLGVDVGVNLEAGDKATSVVIEDVYAKLTGKDASGATVTYEAGTTGYENYDYFAVVVLKGIPQANYAVDGDGNITIKEGSIDLDAYYTDADSAAIVYDYILAAFAG